MDGTAFAKFVPAEVLSVKCQTSADVTSMDDTAKIRVISTVDSLKYSQVGFDLTFKGRNLSYKTSTVLSGIQAATDGVAYGFSPNIFDLQSKYFITATIVNIPNSDFDEGLLVKPYWVTKDGTTVHGVERYARVEDSYNHIVNVPVKQSAFHISQILRNCYIMLFRILFCQALIILRYLIANMPAAGMYHQIQCTIFCLIYFDEMIAPAQRANASNGTFQI